MNDMLSEDLIEIKTMVSTMNSNLSSVLELSQKILARCKSNELNVEHGISFIETKYQLMLSYLINLIYVVFKKSGSKIESDPSINRLVEIRTYLEKINPIEHKLKYQIEKSIRTAITGEASSNDLTAFKPNLDKLANNSGDSQGDSDSDDDDPAIKKSSKKKSSSSGDRKYVPPKLTTAHYDSGDEEPDAKLGKAKRFALRSSIMQDLKEEYLDTPIEISATSRAQQINSKKIKEKEEYEEKYLTRLPITKQEKHRQRKMTTINTLGNELSYDILKSDKKPTKKRKAGGKSKKGGKKRKFH